MKAVVWTVFCVLAIYPHLEAVVWMKYRSALHSSTNGGSGVDISATARTAWGPAVGALRVAATPLLNHSGVVASAYALGGTGYYNYFIFVFHSYFLFAKYFHGRYQLIWLKILKLSENDTDTFGWRL